MAKGVLLGVMGCVTMLPSPDPACWTSRLQKTRHRPLILQRQRLCQWACHQGASPCSLVIFVAAGLPALYGYRKTNDEVYYDMGQCLPRGY